MEIKRSEFGALIEKCLPGIGTGNSIVEGADTLVFDNGNMLSYNSAIAVRVALPEAYRALTGVVKALDFYNCVVKMPEEIFTLDIVDDVWRLTCKRIKANIKLIEAKNILKRFADVTPDETKWQTVDGAMLQTMLNVTDVEVNKTKYAGVYMTGNTLLSTNGWEISRTTMTTPLPEAWITTDARQELQKWSTIDAVQLNGTWLEFRAGDTVFCVKTLYSKGYPYQAASAVVDTAMNMTPLYTGELSATLGDAIRRAANFSELRDDYNTVDLHFAPDGLHITAARTSGNYEEIIDSILSPRDVTVKVDINAFLSCMSLYTNMSILEDTSAASGGSALRLFFTGAGCQRVISAIV